VLIALAIIIFALLLILSGMVANRPELFLVPGLFCIFKFFMLVRACTYTLTCVCVCVCVCMCVYIYIYICIVAALV